MSLNLISNDRLVNRYGTHYDGIYVWNNDRRIGFLTDLRQKFLKELQEPISSGGFSWRKPQEKRLGANSFGPRGFNKF